MSSGSHQLNPSPEGNSLQPQRPFEFSRDSFSFANELLWEYHIDPATGKTTFGRREPRSQYTLRCFVLTRAARQFHYHAKFDGSQPLAPDETYRRLVRQVLARNPRSPSAPGDEVIFPGYPNLRQFSAAHATMLKATCGRAWRSYVVRSHWRMVFPISRAHQARTARGLAESIRHYASPIVHLVVFPRLSINHSMVFFAVEETPGGLRFLAYDPNDVEKPTELSFNAASREFALPANRYWAGGRLNVIEIRKTRFG